MNKATWFLTRKGLLFSRSVALTASVGTFCGYVGLHTVFLDNYRQFFQFYSSGWEKRLPDRLQEMTTRVVKEIKLTEKQKNDIKFFLATGFDTVHAGSTQLVTGGIVGLPSHFDYASADEVEKTTIKLEKGEAVPWSTPAGRQLQESLVLSERAQKFAVAREMHYCTTHYVYVRATCSSVCILASYLLGSGLAVRFNLYRLPRKARLLAYSLCGGLGLLLFFACKDATAQYWDRLSDRRAALTSPDYLRGGLEYYRKALDRNMALRTLLPKGHRHFTAHGNRNTSVRTSTLPLTARLDYLLELRDRDSQQQQRM